jgi:predicted transcriptional regulator
MSWPPHTIGDDVALVDVIRFIIDEKISAILVHSKRTRKIRGIVTTEDLLEEFARLLEAPPNQPGALLDRK